MGFSHAPAGTVSDHGEGVPRRGKRRDASIDWMRALSLLYIVGFWHLHNYTGTIPWYHGHAFACMTATALALFTLISGFLAGKAGTRPSLRSLGGYYQRRLLRIYPPYLAALIVFTVLKMSGAPFLPSALMINMIVPPPPLTLWFMTMIVLFYIAAPFMLALADRPERLIAVVSAVWVGLFWIDRTVLDLEDRLLIYLPAFTIGIVLANTRPGPTWLRWMAALAAVLGYGLATRATGYDADQSLWMVVCCNASALTIFAALRDRLPANRLIERLSYGGFFLYLFHRPIYVVALKVTGVQAPAGREALLLLVALPVAIGFGIVGQVAYDAVIDKLLALTRTRRIGAAASV